MNEVATSPEIDQLVDDYKGGRLNRRQFVKGAVALGVTVSAAGSILAVDTINSSTFKKAVI